MRTRPVALDLLSIARESYRDILLPLLQGEHRYTALMIGNALANAERELAAGDEAGQRELERLQRLYPEAREREAALAVQLDRYNRNLAVDIRSGRPFEDAKRKEKIRAHLVQTTLDRLRESNPKYLEREGLG